MAEAVVSMVVETLGNLLIEEVRFMQGVGDQVRDIRDELWWMQCFLKDADARQYEDHRIRTWVREIKEIAYDAGDVLESFIAGVESKRGGSILKVLERYSCLACEGIARHNIGSKIQDIETRISKVTTRLQTYGIRSLSENRGISSVTQIESELRRSYSYVEQDDFVGWKEDVESLVKILVNDDQHVIAICGMGGLGKTTLAKRIYHRKEVDDHFEKRVWVCISQQWDLTSILQTILSKLTDGNETRLVYEQRNIGVLVEQVSRIQREKRCLVVLDDIWPDGAWNSLKNAFPIANLKGKLLLTSRSKEVPRHINVDVFVHEPRILNNDECWDLLQKKAFTIPNDPDSKKKETLAAEMVKECCGLPLAVIVLGGTLATKKSLNEWQRVHDSIKSYIRRGVRVRKDDASGGGVSNILGLSYNDLPYQLKPCFLYLAKYDEDTEIETESLYQMWMAESMILSEDRRENESMMDVAESYLDELAQRCMVQVQLAEPLKGRGRFKSCRLHDLMRDLSLSKANEENFIHTLDFRSNNSPDDSLAENVKTRRLVVYHDDENTSSRNLSLNHETRQRLRSLFFIIVTSDDAVCSMPPMVKSKLKNFKMLRVLQIEGLKAKTGPGCNVMKILLAVREFYTLPKAIGKLVHMRYFSVKESDFLVLPTSIKNWKQLQTLYLRYKALYFFGCHANMLRKMRQLEHLYLPKGTEKMFKSSTKLQLDSLSKLETLENFDTDWCDSKGLCKLAKLRRFTATVKDTADGEQVIEYLNSAAAEHMRYCKVTINRCINIDTEEGKITLRNLLTCDRLTQLKIYEANWPKIPRYDEVQIFSQSLATISLTNTGLIEDPMPTLEKLPSLQYLYIDEFGGKKLFFSEKGFPQLKSLYLFSATELDDWTVEKGAMPMLSKLYVSGPSNLESIPDGLRFLTALTELRILRMSEALERRVQVIDGEEGEDFDKIRHVESVEFST